MFFFRTGLIIPNVRSVSKKLDEHDISARPCGEKTVFDVSLNFSEVAVLYHYWVSTWSALTYSATSALA